MTVLLICVLRWDWSQNAGWSDRDLRALRDLRSCGCTRHTAEALLARCQRHFERARRLYLSERDKEATGGATAGGGAGEAGDGRGVYPGQSIVTCFYTQENMPPTWWSGQILEQHKTRGDLWRALYTNGDQNWVQIPDAFGCACIEEHGKWKSEHFELGDRIMDVDGGQSAQAFKEAVARAGGSSSSTAHISIVNVEAMARRRPSAPGVRVDVSVDASDKDAADDIAARLTADDINSELKRARLPAAAILEAATVVENTTVVRSNWSCLCP